MSRVLIISAGILLAVFSLFNLYITFSVCTKSAPVGVGEPIVAQTIENVAINVTAELEERKNFEKINTERMLYHLWQSDSEHNKVVDGNAIPFPGSTSHVKTFVAIAAPTRSQDTWKSVEDSSMYNIYMPSILKSIRKDEFAKYKIVLYFGYDVGDPFWENEKNVNDIKAAFPQVKIIFNAYPQIKKGRIPHNEICRTAYHDGADYIVRVNDDSEFSTSGWITMGIHRLQFMQPTNIGVVGPTCFEGKTTILTHDMTHRTHMEIFKENYYPLAFDNWWIDDWITFVYGDRMSKLAAWIVTHHVKAHGTRYEVDKSQELLLDNEVEEGKQLIEAYAQEYTIDSKMLNLIFEAERLRDRNPFGKYVTIQLFDRGFINLIKHWACNMSKLDERILETVLFVATDEKAYNRMRALFSKVNIVLLPFKRTKTRSLSYGQVAYYELMHFRTKILHNLLNHDVSFLLVEADAVWMENALQVIQDLQWDQNSYDMISASDQHETNRLQGGFQLNVATEKSKKVWKSLRSKMEDKIKELQSRYGKGSSKYVKDEGSEQLMMEEILETEGKAIGHKLRYLPRSVVSSGQWYKSQEMRDEFPKPAVILNNWISGNNKKIARAKKWKHFCSILSGTCKCSF